MFYAKALKFKTTKYYNVDFNAFSMQMNTSKDENLMSIKQASLSYNFNSKSGALKTGHGFADLKLPMFSTSQSAERTILLPSNVNIKKVWQYKFYNPLNKQKEHILMFYGGDNQVYYTYLIQTSNSCYSASGLTFTETPNACNYRLDDSDVMIFTSPQDSMKVYDPASGTETISTAPKITTMCVHGERLFAVSFDDKRTLRFSDDLDPTNWTTSLTEGGYLTFADELGDIGKVVSFGDYLYLVRDYGITKITAFGSQADFSVSNVFYSSSKIFPSSCANCGDVLLFLAKDGIYSFDGSNAQKIDLGIDALYENTYNESAEGCYYAGKYYLALRLDFSDDVQIGCEADSSFVNNALIEINLKESEWNLTRGIDILCMTAIEEANASKLVACFSTDYQKRIGQLTDDGKFFGTAMKKVWLSPKTHLGYPGKKKIIRDVYLKSLYPITLKITADDTSKSFSISGSEKMQVFHPKVVGENLQVSFESTDANCFVSWPRSVVGVVS